jgi:phosphoglycerate dehydrogenase-like enzyme
MNPVHVLLSCKVSPEQLERIRSVHPRLVIHGEAGGYAIMPASEVDYKGIDYPDERPDRDVESMVRQAEVIVATRIPESLGKRAPALRWLQFTSAGVDHLWRSWLDEGRVTVTCARSIHAKPMAEFALGCILFFAKGFRQMLDQQAERIYRKFLMREIADRTMCLVGVGEIGGAIAARAQDFGLKTIGVRRHADRPHPHLDEIVAEDRWHEALARADYVVSSLPLTERTRGMFDAAAFRAMRPDAVFVNVGRGKTVVESDLIGALKEKRIGGAALDVFEREPLPADSPLWAMENVLVSPHMAADTPLYMERFTDILCDNLRRYATGEPLRNVVDVHERY